MPDEACTFKKALRKLDRRNSQTVTATPFLSLHQPSLFKGGQKAKSLVRGKKPANSSEGRLLEVRTNPPSLTVRQ